MLPHLHLLALFLDLLYEYPIFTILHEKRESIHLWLSMIDWIEENMSEKYQTVMLENHWHNFFIALESVVKNKLKARDMKAISAIRKLFNSFYKLLSENCNKPYDVRFYADKLCITLDYLSRTLIGYSRLHRKNLLTVRS